MPYVLGVDVGSTRTTAAVCRLGGAGRAEPEPVGLGGPGGGVATSLLLTADGAFAVGEPGDPRWTATGFHRRVGDAVPVVLGTARFTAEELTALLVLWVVGRVAEREGEAAERVVLAHPPSWGPHARALAHRALNDVGLPDVTLLAKPLAAAAAFGRGPVGVLGLGAHTCHAAVVRPPFDLVAWADGVDVAAGADYDDLVFEHVRAALGRDFAALDPDDPRTRGLHARLRRDCEAAKRVLSHAFEAVVPVHLPTGVVEVPLTRAEFEGLIRPHVEEAAAVFERVARVLTPEVTVVVGGTARVPLVPAALPGRVVREAAPETTVARGAAVAGRDLLLGPDEPEPVETSVLVRDDDPLLRFPVGSTTTAEDAPEPPPRPPVDITPLDLPGRRSVRHVVRGLASVGRGRGRGDGR
ncbi:Hsp70 family protein [Saccharothrix obliqua]|uniref:Hsp70 family protein n=1 Tax=Saccharothrix obliqua TaxID=2861747 RepID=UPI001C5E8EFE|nr:Hsp70 family protein [Saccharothrix obliqua]MBW4719049.1 Hsp70 family protein [Saccharothrix obliqua]